MMPKILTRAALYGLLAVVLAAAAALFLALREFREASGVALGTPRVLGAIQAELRGDLIRTPRPPDVPCPASIVTPANKRGRKAMEGLGVDLDREAVLSTFEIPRGGAPYGLDGALAIDKRTGEVVPHATPRNPLAAVENRWEILVGLAAREAFPHPLERDRILGAHLGVTWEAASVRLGKTGYRLFLKPRGDLLVFPGAVEVAAGVDGAIR